jgi:glycosyltransferase involved in cell wall biosynthesis
MGGVDFLPGAERPGIPVIRLGRGGYVWPTDLFRLWVRLRSHPPDIFLLFTGIPNIWGRVFGRLIGVPIIVGACRDHILWYERFLGRLAHHHACNSHAIRRYAIEEYRLPEKQMNLIPNGVDLGHFFPPEIESCSLHPVVLHIGRLVKDKDQATLISAFCRIAGEFPAAELWIVGDGPLRQKLGRMARESFCADRIRMMPGQADIGPLLRRAEVFVLGSLRESLPNVVLEAMASGLPVVATQVGGLPEAVESGKTGLLVPPSSPQAMANALRSLLADPERRADFGRAGRRKAEAEFSLQRMVGGYDALFQELLAKCPLS